MSSSAALVLRRGGVALACEALAAAAVAGTEALALGVEFVVGEAALVEPCARLVEVGLGALAAGLLLGVLRARGTVLGALAVGAGDLFALAHDLALAGLG